METPVLPSSEALRRWGTWVFICNASELGKTGVSIRYPPEHEIFGLRA